MHDSTQAPFSTFLIAEPCHEPRVNMVTSPIPVQAGPETAPGGREGRRPVCRDREAEEGAVLRNKLRSTRRAEERGLLAAIGHAAREPSLPVWISYSVYLVSCKLAHTALRGIQSNQMTPPITYEVRTVPLPCPSPWESLVSSHPL